MKFWAKTIFTATLAVSPLAAHAAIISNDLLTVNDNLLTFDSTTNLSWLDWDYTAGQSYDDIFARTLDADDELYGFRYAKKEDFIALTSSLGMVFNDYIRETTEIQNANLLQDYLGVTNPASNLSLGISGEFPGYNKSDVFVLALNNNGTRYALQQQYNSKTAQHDQSYNNFGHALVKDFTVVAEVPEPESIAIFALGLSGLMWRRLRNKT